MIQEAAGRARAGMSLLDAVHPAVSMMMKESKCPHAGLAS